MSIQTQTSSKTFSISPRFSGAKVSKMKPTVSDSVSGSNFSRPGADTVDFRNGKAQNPEPRNIQAGIEEILNSAKSLDQDQLQETLQKWQSHPEFDSMLQHLYANQNLPKGSNSQSKLRQEIAYFIFRNPEKASSDLLQKTAFEPDDPSRETAYLRGAVSELNNRQESGRLQALLKQSNQEVPSKLFAFCNILRSLSLTPEEFYAWSRRVKALTQQGGANKIENLATEMKKIKKTDRVLSDYQTRLNISDEALFQLKGKRICLVGGGNSPVRQGLEEKNLNTHVTNIDPIFRDSSPLNEHRKLPNNYFDRKAKQLLKKEKFHDIWALNSLPQYAMTPQETFAFYKQSLLGLKPKGILQVAPVHSFNDSLNGEMILSRPLVNKVSKNIVSALENAKHLFKVERYETTHAGLMGKVAMPGAKIQVINNNHFLVSEFLRKLEQKLLHSVK